MDRDTEREFKHVNKRVEDLEDEQKVQRDKINNLARDILRLWHLGVGIGLGLLVKELGIEKLLGKFL